MPRHVHTLVLVILFAIAMVGCESADEQPEAVPSGQSAAAEEFDPVAAERIYDDEPEVAAMASTELEDASAGDDLGGMVLRAEDAGVVGGIDDLEVDERTWRRTGRVATVDATTGGETYTVWLVEVDGAWLVSHTSGAEATS